MSALNARSPLRGARSNTNTNKRGLLGHVHASVEGLPTSQHRAPLCHARWPSFSGCECRPSAASDEDSRPRLRGLVTLSGWARGQQQSLAWRRRRKRKRRCVIEATDAQLGGNVVMARWDRRINRHERSSRTYGVSDRVHLKLQRTSAPASLSHRPSAAAGCPPHPMHHGCFVRSVSLIVREAHGTFCLVAPERYENLRIHFTGIAVKLTAKLNLIFDPKVTLKNSLKQQQHCFVHLS